MYNTELPRRAELPSTGRLLRSTFLALIAAAFLLVTVVLPSEYAIDPSGLGRGLGLTQMGEIKMQLAREAEADKAASTNRVPAIEAKALAAQKALDDRTGARLDAIERRLDKIVAILARPRVPATPRKVAARREEPQPTPPKPANAWKHEVSFTLKPGQGIELKLVMKANAVADFEWTANGSVLNFDTHGDGSGRSISYKKGRGVPGERGALRAAFTGNHGWFWRNRTQADVTLTLRTRGQYSELKRTA